MKRRIGKRFDQLLTRLNIPRPQECLPVEAAVAAAEKIGYPVVVRPSYVLGGRAMEIVFQQKELEAYMTWAVQVTPDHPVCEG